MIEKRNWQVYKIRLQNHEKKVGNCVLYFCVYFSAIKLNIDDLISQEKNIIILLLFIIVSGVTVFTIQGYVLEVSGHVGVKPGGCCVFVWMTSHTVELSAERVEHTQLSR